MTASVISGRLAWSLWKWSEEQNFIGKGKSSSNSINSILTGRLELWPQSAVCRRHTSNLLKAASRLTLKKDLMSISYWSCYASKGRIQRKLHGRVSATDWDNKLEKQKKENRLLHKKKEEGTQQLHCNDLITNHYKDEWDTLINSWKYEWTDNNVRRLRAYTSKTQQYADYQPSPPLTTWN